MIFLVKRPPTRKPNLVTNSCYSVALKEVSVEVDDVVAVILTFG